MRTDTLFNSDWLYAPQPLPFNAPDTAFEAITLPHTNRLFSHRQVDSEAYQFISTYRKRFKAPDITPDQRVYIDFGGAMLVSTVYLNDHLLGTHGGGYTPFSFELTPYLLAGENVLTVILDSNERDDIPPNGNVVDYLLFGGIYRDVRLRVVNTCHIVKVFARPEEVLAAPKLTCEVHLSTQTEGLTLRGILKDADGGVIAADKQPVTESHMTLTFSDLAGVDLWSIGHPVLYTLELALQDNGSTIDTISQQIGFRHTEFRPDGFYLNGQRLKLFGLNRHQTYPYIGAAAPERLQRQDADILKYELGCNIVRTSHYPQSPHFLNRCDEIGLLVLEEIVGWQHIGDEDWQALVLRDLQVMIERDRNHPSIILWGVRVNESPDHDELYTKTNALAHQLDPTRQTGGIRNRRESSFLEDVYTYNDFADGIWEPEYSPYLITEFGGHMFPTKTWDNEERRIEHALIHVRKHNLQMGREDVSGAIGWCAFDYHTHKEFGSGDRICHHGVMDMFRLPKWAAYFYQSQQPPDQRIVLQAATHWTIGERSGGGNNPLIVFSNCDEIAVSIGQHFVGRFQPDRENYPYLPHPPFTIRWPEPYNPWGIKFDDLTVLGYLDGKPVAEHKIAADHQPHCLDVQADAPRLQADGADMTRVVVRLLDRYGNVLPYYHRLVRFEVEGEADVIGENPLMLIGGQAAVFLRARHTAGMVRLHAYIDDLPTVSVMVEIAPDQQGV